jgi:hypothetical protein
MYAYRRGLTGPLLECAMKKYSGHRGMLAGVTVAAIQEDNVHLCSNLRPQVSGLYNSQLLKGSVMKRDRLN